MLVKTKKVLYILLLIMVLIFGCYVFVLNFFKGPTLIINNCNSNNITDSRVCHNSNDYYYLDSNGSIYHYNEKGTEVFDNTRKINYITCNSDYLYASDKESLFQYDLDGELIKSINSNSCDSIYALIDGIYATEECVFCKLGGSSYLLIDPNSLETIIINDILENGEWETIENVQIACGGDIRMASLAIPVEVNKCYFYGTISYNDNCVNLGNEGIIGLSDFGCIEYHSFNDTILKNLYNDAEYNIELTDIRHIFLDEELLIAFNSDYNDNSFLKKFLFFN